jgi:hypothetical protein
MLFDLDIHLFYLEYVCVCIQKTLLIFFEIVFCFKLIFFMILNLLDVLMLKIIF